MRPGVPLEPLNLAFKLKGKEALGNILDRNDVSALSDVTRSWSKAILGKDVEHDSLDERRLGRALIKAVVAEMPEARSAFETLARRRHAHTPEILSEDEFEIEPDDLAALRAARRGDDLSEVLGRIEARIVETRQDPKAAPLVPLQLPSQSALQNGNRLTSDLWPEFCDAKITMDEWQTNEKVAARTTLKLFIQACGDRRPRDYTSLDIARFHSLYKGLPSNYYHDKSFRATYESKGIEVLVEETKDQQLPRTTAKAWNSHNSPLHGFFQWCAGKGCAIAKGTDSICKDEFVKIPKRKGRKKVEDGGRRIYEMPERELLFSAPKLRECRSARFWKQPGSLVFRDHRYWMFLLIALHGNRREEAAILKVKHVRQSKGGIWYFNWASPDLVHLLKDVGSPRDVPLHKDLLALGFLEARVLGRDSAAPVFPEALSYGEMKRHAEPFGKWYAHYCDSLGITDKALDLHSWRHTVVTLLGRAGVPHHICEQIVGHESTERRSELRAIQRIGRFRPATQDPQRSHTLGSHLQAMDSRAKTIHPQPAPANAGSMQLGDPARSE